MKPRKQSPVDLFHSAGDDLARLLLSRWKRPLLDTAAASASGSTIDDLRRQLKPPPGSNRWVSSRERSANVSRNSMESVRWLRARIERIASALDVLDKFEKTTRALANAFAPRERRAVPYAAWVAIATHVQDSPAQGPKPGCQSP